MASSPSWSPPVSRLVVQNVKHQRTSSLRVLVVGEQVVEDSEGGLEVQVDDIWKRKVGQRELLRDRLDLLRDGSGK